MLAVETSQIVPVLQTAVSPVVLISGVGLLLLTMTNRLGRIVDRARSLAGRLREIDGEDKEPIQAQLRILSQRGRMVRRSIALAAFCVLFAALLVISLFITSLFGHDLPWLVAAFFILSLVCLIASLVEFIRDVNRSLEATALEVGEEWEKK
jgi:peptidoglycan/LPS O-acetylase OafA/YrhL